MYSLQQIAVALLAALCLYILRITWLRQAYTRKMRRQGCQPIHQYPHKDPVFGYDLHKIQAGGIARGQTIAMWTELYDKCGQTFGSNWIGQRVVTTCDKDNIQTVLGLSSSHLIMSPLRNKIAEPFLAKGLLTRDGKAWQAARGLAISVLGKEQAADLPSLEEHLKKLIKLIPQDGSTVDVQPLFKRLFTDKGTELVLGESLNSLSSDGSDDRDPEVAAFLALFEDNLRNMGARLRLGNLRFIRGRDAQWKRNCATVNATLDKFVERAMDRRSASKSPSRYILADRCLDVTDDKVEIRTQLINVLLAGRDQIGISISMVVFALARHPRVWRKLREEALATPVSPSFESVRGLSYTRKVIYEALRLYSPVLRSIRHCDKDCVLPHGGGKDGLAPILIQRGVQIDLDFAVMHREKSIWGDDAEDFVPERWDEGSLAQNWEYMPFLAGKRTCPARDMVLTQMTYCLSRLAGEFEVLENRDPVLELVDDVRNVRQSRNGVLVAFARASAAVSCS